MVQILNIDTQIFFGEDAINELAIPSGFCLLVVSGSADSSRVAQIKTVIEKNNATVHLIEKPAGEPSSAMVDDAFDGLPAFDSIVSLGGGSTLDFAKALAILGGSGGQIAEYEFGDRTVDTIKPMYFVPTTCGTGSEVTPYTVINNSVSGRKFTLFNPEMRAKQAAIDPELLNDLPDDILLPTALDAFTHCLEALLTRSDKDVIWPIATEGLRIAWRSLPPACRLKSDKHLRADLARLSVYGGISIAHNRTGLIHTMSVAFAQFCHLPHGLLNSRLLPHAIKHNLDGYEGLLADVVSAASGDTYTSDQEAYAALVSWLHDIIGDDLPMTKAEITDHKDALVARISQDGGLPGVCHGDVSEDGLNRLIEGMAHA